MFSILRSQFFLRSGCAGAWIYFIGDFQEDYLKWKGSLFFRFILTLLDPQPEISSFGNCDILLSSSCCCYAGGMFISLCWW